MTEIESAEFVQLVNDKENAEFNDNRKRPHSEGDTPPKKAKIDEVTLSDDSDQQSPAKSEDIDCAKKSTLGKSPHSSSRSAKRKEEQEAERLKKLEERQKAQEEKRHQQELKRQEREKKEREKEQKKREEEEKRKKREEEKEAKRLEEEEKRKKREEEKERKRQEEELKLAKKREEEQIRLAKKYEEELIRRAEEAKKQRQSNAFITRRNQNRKKKRWKKRSMRHGIHQTRQQLYFLDVDYKAELIERLKTIPLVKASVTGSMKAKLFQFHSNYRPPYYGTWRKRPGKGVNGRRPLGKMSELDYDADSDADWEEEPDDAESCHSNEVDEDAENDDEEEDDEGFFVEPGYLSDGEGECPETGSGAEEATNDDEPADVRAARLAERARKWEAAIHRKRSTKLQPNVLGPYKSGAPLPLENLAFEIL